MFVMQEILNKYQIRKTKKQKEKFIEYIKEKAKELNYNKIKIEQGGKIIKNKNIIIGDEKDAMLFLTAHYDTCAWSPVPNIMFPTNAILFVIYQLFILFYFLFFGFLVTLICAFLFPNIDPLMCFELFICIIAFQMMFGFANKHTANDNTSGVVTLLSIMEKIPKEKRNKICFVFFDNEEKGMWGSRLFYKNHRDYIDDKLLINFDCVGDGENILFAASKKAINNSLYNDFKNSINEKHYSQNIIFEKIKLLLFPSDQVLFKTSVGVATLKKSKIIGLYAGKIHTLKDMVCQEDNINVLSDIIIKYIKS